MKDKRILYVSSEVVPYLAENEVSLMSYDVPKMINDQGGQIRIFMPRYGNINERRHQLHEVIRLSGMNLVVNDLDMPLIIKVASIPKDRIQVYFIDNDEYFKRKATFTDEEGALFPDNDERAIFFAKGVVETVKKLNWVPDIIHFNGWMASFIPIYLKNYYKTDSYFNEVALANEKIDTIFKKVKAPILMNFESIFNDVHAVDALFDEVKKLSETTASFTIKNTDFTENNIKTDNFQKSINEFRGYRRLCLPALHHTRKNHRQIHRKKTLVVGCGWRERYSRHRLPD